MAAYAASPPLPRHFRYAERQFTRADYYYAAADIYAAAADDVTLRCWPFRDDIVID